MLKKIRVLSGLALILAATVSCGGTTPAPTLPAVTAATPTSLGSAQGDSTQGDRGFTPQDPMSMPEGTGPPGLNSINSLQDNDSIMALFERLPSSLLGRNRADEIQASPPAKINASYGKTKPLGCGMVGLQAMDVSTGDFYPPGWTAEKVIALLASGEDSTDGEFGRDGELFWLNLQTFCSTGSSLKDSLDITTWGVAGSPWVFSATAQDIEGRDELVAAFVAASE